MDVLHDVSGMRVSELDYDVSGIEINSMCGSASLQNEVCKISDNNNEYDEFGFKIENNDKLAFIDWFYTPFFGSFSFCQDDINSSNIKNKSLYEKKCHIYNQNLQKKINQNKNQIGDCTGWRCICNGIYKYGYCRVYDYKNWKECDDQAKRNKEIWDLFPETEYRPRAQSEEFDQYIILPLAIEGKKRKNTKKIKVPDRRPYGYKLPKNYKRNKTY
jgi:hypothetical protein